MREESLAIIDNKRIVSLDVIRGAALLGILIMNIQSFSMPTASYLNPTVYGSLTGIDYYVWLISHLFADMKFMNIFSMLFGAGVLLFIQRAELKTGRSLGIHYRRSLWLLLFGLLHAHLIWYGDILYSYAMCAFLVYWFRNLTAIQLSFSALLLLIFDSGFSLLIGFNLSEIPSADIEKIMITWRPSSFLLDQEISTYLGSYLEQFSQRSAQAFIMETDLFINVFVWRVTAMMLLGMALFKWQLFSPLQSSRFYRNLAFSCFFIGMPTVAWGTYQNLVHDFSMAYSLFIGSQFNYWGSILVSIAYISFICWWLKGDLLPSLRYRLACIGKMAFTHYIFHSLVFTLIFYGHGLGLFASLPRWQSIIIVFLMWVFQLIISPLWLRHFQYGPLEWLWRCLTYWKVQSIKLRS